MSDIAVLHGAETGQIARAVPQARAVQDSLILEVANIETDVLTGVYSEETGRPQPLRISIAVALQPQAEFAASRAGSPHSNCRFVCELCFRPFES